jgi:hypothetical protein
VKIFLVPSTFPVQFSRAGLQKIIQQPGHTMSLDFDDLLSEYNEGLQQRQQIAKHQSYSRHQKPIQMRSPKGGVKKPVIARGRTR